MKPLVSVCIITYNHEKYISEAIESVLMQKTDFPFDIIIHDDASNDNTAQLVKEYAEKHKQIKTIFQKENKYSKGYKPLVEYIFPICEGKYIAICEGDDYWTDPYKLQKQVDFLEANDDYIITYHNAKIINENNEIVNNSKLTNNLKKDFSQEELIKGTMILTLTMCFKNVIREFPEELFKVKNGDKFLTSLLGNFGKGKYQSEIEDAVYRKHGASIWSSLEKVKQVFYNGDTRAWLSRYYNRIGKMSYANYFKEESIKHFKRIFSNNIKGNLEEKKKLGMKIFSDYKDIIDNPTENKLKETLKVLENSSDLLSNNFETIPPDFEYMSCSYLENSIAYYYDNLVYTCCYIGYIGDEGIISTLSNNRFNPKELIKNKKKLILKRMEKEYGGCIGCPKLYKKKWRKNWDFKIKHINLNHLLACNLNCSYCGYVDKRGIYKHTKTEAIIDSIEKLEESNLISSSAEFYIGNGEPSISKDMDKLIEYIINKKSDYKVVVQSNGTIYKEIYTKGIYANKLSLILTPDAGSAESYLKIKGKDYFDTVWKNIKNYANETNGNIKVKVIMQNNNVEEVKAIIRLCEQSNVKNLVVDVDLNIRNKIGTKILSTIGEFYKIAKNKKVNIFPGTHWPKNIKESFDGSSITKAESYIAQNNLVKAKEILNILNKIHVKNTNVLNDLAVVAIMEGDIKEALKFIKNVLELEKKNEIALENFDFLVKNFLLEEIEQQIAQNNLDIAKQNLRQLLEVHSENIDVLNDLAVVTIMESNIEEAIMIIEKILSIEPLNEIAKENYNYLKENFEITQQKKNALNKNNNSFQKVGNQDLLDNNILTINWVITRKCNYSCSYCRVYDNSGKFTSLEDLKNAMDQIAELNKSKYKITLTGGEPTIHPNYLTLLKYIFEKLGKRATIITISNLGRTEKYFEKLLEEIKEFKNNIVFVASFHTEFANEDEFVNKAKLISEKGFYIKVQIMAHPEKMEQIRYLDKKFKEIKNKNLKYQLMVIRENYGSVPDKRYNSEDLEWLKVYYSNENEAKNILIETKDLDSNIAQNYYSAPEINAKGLNNYKGMLCYAGVNSFSINKDGKIDRAVCFRGKNKDARNIYTEKNALQGLDEPIICPFERCGCTADIKIPKFTNAEVATVII